MTSEVMNGHQLDQIVTFRLGNEHLAVPIRIVQEIVRLPDVRKVPNAPPYVDGVGNLRGKILPVVNLRRRLGIPTKEEDERTRVLVLNVGGTTNGLVVDSVSEVLRTEKQWLEEPPSTVAGVDGQYLRAVAKVHEGRDLILILDEDKIIPGFDGRMENDSVREESSRSVMRHDATEQVVTFKVGGEECAIGIMQVKEIIRVTNIRWVPKAPAFIVGVMSLRNQLLPIMDLRTRFGMPTLRQSHPTDEEILDAQRIVVVDLGGVLTGILVDSVSQVLSLEKSFIEPPPPIIEQADSNRLRGVGKLDNGKRLIMLLDIEGLVSDEEKSIVERIAQKGAESLTSTTDGRRGEEHKELHMVCFRVDKEEYAIDIMKVQEIIRVNQITSVPQTSRYVEGIINLRGNVIPVVDMRLRFGLPEKERTEQNRIVVVTVNGKTTGLIADSVTDVLRIQTRNVEEPPEALLGLDGKCFDGIAKLNDGRRIIVLIKPEALLLDDTASHR